MRDREIPMMTLKIEAVHEGDAAVLRIVGRVESEYVNELSSQMRAHHASTLDLDEVTLVDIAAVRFLAACDADGVELLNCPPYIREWMSREQHRAV